MASHSSILAWRIIWTKEPGRLEYIGSQRVRHDRTDLACMHTFSFISYVRKPRRMMDKIN